MISTTDHCIDVCNKLLRGERSAVETYDKAIEKYHDHPAMAQLRSIRDEHSSFVSRLEEHVIAMDGTPDKSAGAWGAFANTVQSAANLLGEGSAVSALKTGEKNGESDYEQALSDENVMEEIKSAIRSEFLPRTREHIATLDAIKEVV